MLGDFVFQGPSIVGGPADQGRNCVLCGLRHAPWRLIGGGYEDNWFASLLREAFPVALCERCFRSSFYKSDDIEEIGLAVLPCVEVRSLRALEVEKFLITTRRLYGTACFDAEKFLTAAEIEGFLRDEVIHRSLLVDSKYGTVAVRYSFDAVLNDGLNVRLSKSQSSETGLLGLGLDTRIEIVCLASQYRCIRTVADFYWLRELLVRSNSPKISQLPLLSLPVRLDNFVEGLLSMYLSTYLRFLKYICTNEPFSSSRALHAFLRPGFDLARAVVDVAEEKAVITSVFFSLGDVRPRLERDGNWARIAECLSEVRNIMASMTPLQVDLVATLVNPGFVNSEDVRTLTTSPVNNLNDVDVEPLRYLVDFCTEQMAYAESTRRRLANVEDFFRV